MVGRSQFLRVALGIFKCDEVIKGFYQLQVRTWGDECVQLCGGVVFFSEIWY
jgi:hypothetical protein